MSVAEPRRDQPPYAKADLTLRGLARGFDFAVALALGLAAPFVVGPLLAAGYLAVADGLLHGQSPGKRLFGVRVVLPRRRLSAGFSESLERNAPFAVVALCWALPLLWPVFVLVGLPVVAVEAWRAWREPLGLRYGDLLAETQVVDGKVMVSDPTPARLGAVTPAPPGQAARAGGSPPAFTRHRRRARYGPPNSRTQVHRGERMANSKSKHIRMKSRRRQQWKARKLRQAAAKKASKK